MRFVDVGGCFVPDDGGTFIGPVGFDAGPIESPNGVLAFLNDCLRWSSSYLSNWGLEETVLALCVRVLMTLKLTARLW